MTMNTEQLTSVVFLPDDSKEAFELAAYAARSSHLPFITCLREGEVFITNKNHPLYGAAKAWAKAGLAANSMVLQGFETGLDSIEMEALNIVLAQLKGTKAINHIVGWVEDSLGHVCRQYTIECRTVSTALLLGESAMSASVEWTLDGWRMKGATSPLSISPTTVVPEAPILHQPPSAKSLEAGQPTRAAEEAKKEGTIFSQRIFRLARAQYERNEAINAFKILFQFYSFNEELWRLKEWMTKLLPFALEDAPELKEQYELLEKQTGHIDDLTKFYAEESPSHVTSVEYVQTAHMSLAPRYQWLISECRKRGIKKVAELGSVDGISIFPLMQSAPDIEWHGFEVSEEAVRHGHEVAKAAGIENFHLHHVKEFTFAGVMGYRRSFDAVFVSEVLEHNNPVEGGIILGAAEQMVKPSEGFVFISTPNGNWSICDENTRDLELRKDHINAYTPERMKRFLQHQANYATDSIEVKAVENPSFWEANSWVFASYRLDGVSFRVRP